jgi:hypothetical protein
LALQLTGCSRSVGKSDLLGRYSADIGEERQIIEIRPDGVYDTSFYRYRRLIWRNDGHWTFGNEQSLDGDAITFAQFRFGFREYAGVVPALWPVRAERSWSGRIELCFDPDISDRCFVKVPRL